MIGFVTFVYPETVKLILAKGNLILCDARVLVKPYKERARSLTNTGSCSISSNKWRESSQHVGGPTGFDSRDPYDLQHGARMFGDTPKTYCGEELEEQADLQQAIELQGRRLMGLQLLDVKRHNHHRIYLTFYGSETFYSFVYTFKHI